MPRIVSLSLVCGICIVSVVAAAEPAGLQELRVGKQVTQGKVIAQDDKVCLMLSQDGRMIRVDKTATSTLKQVSAAYQPWSSAIVRDKLKREFGSQFAVVGTRHYLVCARTDRQAKEYGELFEELFGSFQRYFNVRGLKVTEPEFPMIAIVFPDQSSFSQYAKKDAARVLSNMVGYYSPQSNRIALFDRGPESTAGLKWLTEPGEFHSPQRPLGSGRNNSWANVNGDTKDTIIHEATHQLAFNMGLHSRVGETPQWVVEGMATVFEAPGIRNSSANLGPKTRINHDRYVWFGNFQKTRRKPKSLEAFIAGDDLFQSSALDAYSQAWALTFFLVETRSRQYAKYLQTISARNPFADYPAEARVTDFKQAFGSNLAILEAEFLRFVTSGIK
ncbi:MAG: DUF1570 domain-containing protein [Planctomycetales bacterium]|nr:DUF1570 domain-containing protein [Planctomycetales bacterium]